MGVHAAEGHSEKGRFIKNDHFEKKRERKKYIYTEIEIEKRESERKRKTNRERERKRESGRFEREVALRERSAVSRDS